MLIKHRRITDLSQNPNLKLPGFSNASLACIKILKPNGWFQNEKTNKAQTKAQGAGSLSLIFSEERTACSQPVTWGHLKVGCKTENDKNKDI